MRFIHTADWHLGQTFHGYDRLPEQRLFLDWLGEELEQRRADALLISGDIFDTITPSAAAQKLFFEFLADTHRKLPFLQVVLTAGNHDSGMRLEAPLPVLESLNVRVIGLLPRDAEHCVDYRALGVPLSGADGVAAAMCLAVPFLRAGDCPTPSGDESAESLFFRELSAAFEGCDLPLICMAHLYAVGGELSGADVAERVMGGLEGVGESAFGSRYAYVALGHLHRMQRVFGRNEVRYSGSPISMSFGEKGYSHGVLLVELEGDECCVEPLLYASPVQLLAFEGTPAEVREQIAAQPVGEVDDFAPIVSLSFRLDAPHPGLKADVESWAKGRYLRLGPMHIAVRRSGEESERVVVSHPHSLSAVEIAAREYESVYGGPMPAELERLFAQVVAEVER